MTTVTQLQADIALRLHDASNEELSTANLLILINQAVRWLKNSGWLLPIEEDESLTQANDTYEYTVPAGFAYIHQLRSENLATNTYDGYRFFPHESWRLAIEDSVAKIIFDEARFIAEPGAHIKIMGQKRPTIYTLGADTVDEGLENILLERALYYAFQFVAAGRSEYAGWRQQEAVLARAESELALSRAPQQFRMKPNSRHVPGR